MTKCIKSDHLDNLTESALIWVMLKLVLAVIVALFIGAVFYFIFDYEKELRCPKCNREMNHWDDKTIYCNRCKVVKKLW